MLVMVATMAKMKVKMLSMLKTQGAIEHVNCVVCD